jgi:replication factor C small subunit
MAAKELWTEKYRPSTLDGYVFKDSIQQKQIESWVTDRSIPHLLLSGSPGTGKTTLAKVLCHLLEIPKLDFKVINASRHTSIDFIRDTIVNFTQMTPFGPFKVVLLDEADYLSPNAQAALRGLMEERHSTARFILTCNHSNRILPAIVSRCQGFHVNKLDITEYTTRVAKILISEEVVFDLDTLDTFVKANYPDLRKCINMVQQYSIGGKLIAPTDTDADGSDYKFGMVELFKSGKISEARKLICSKARPEEIEDMYRWLYDNIELFGDNEEQQELAICVIKQGLVDHTLVIDPEINLSATLIKLSHIKKGP